MLNSPRKTSIAKSPVKSAFKNTMADTAQPEPVIKDGWVEIGEESGIVREGDVFESIHQLFLECKGCSTYTKTIFRARVDLGKSKAISSSQVNPNKQNQVSS